MPSFDPYALPADLPPVPIGVFLFNDGATLVPLPHVRCTRVAWHEGARPAEAEFRYVLDDDALAGHPPGFAQLLGLGNAHPGVLREDDRLVVAWQAPGGQLMPIFDGFVRLPELSIDGEGLRVPIQAVQVAVRAWDTVMRWGYWRHSQFYDQPGATVGGLSLPTRFNPEGKPNCTGEGYDFVDHLGLEYPVFIDPTVPLPDSARRHWTLDLAAWSLLCQLEGDQDWIKIPTAGQLRTALSRALPTGPGPIDPGDDSTYRRVRPAVNDQSPIDRPWPEFLEQMLAAHGFRFRFSLRVGATGLPETTLVFYHETDPIPGPWYGPVYLQLPGEAVDPSRSNLSRAQIQRDSTQVVNHRFVRLAPTRHEAAFVLLPGFEPEADDALPENITKFQVTEESPEVDPRKYRAWAYGETGEGWYKAGEWRQGPEHSTAFNVILGEGRFVQRRRPAVARLVSRDGDDRPLRARLGILLNYEGPAPGTWDGTGDVYWIKGGWQLDDERLGILVTANDPNDWAIGGHEGVNGLNGGRLPLIRWLAGTPWAAARDVMLVLLCAIDADQAEFADTGLDPSSPSAFEVRRTTDSSDRHRFEVVHKSSPNFDPDREATDGEGNPLGYMIVRDDRARAMQDAEARLAATAYPAFAGSLTLPRFAVTYPVGGRVTGIVGHDLSFRLDAGSEGPGVYPRIVRVDWQFEGGQYTTLHLSDSRFAGQS